MRYDNQMKNFSIILAFLVILGTIGFFAFRPSRGLLSLPASESSQTSSSQTSTKGNSPMATPVAAKLTKPSLTIDAKKAYTAVLHTSKGDITIALDAAATPQTVNNFVYLSRQNFYNGSPFHRVISGFMIQGGDPTGTGTGGPGYRFDDEPFEGEYTRGTVAMANAGPNTNGSQFFIMHADYALPKNYVIFGHVTAGMDVVDAIATAPVGPSQSGEMSAPKEPVIITGVDVTEQ